MAQIKMLRHYQNMSGQDLRPDVYDSKDAVLGGLASYLVENGYAEYVTSEAVSDETVTDETPEVDNPRTRKRR